MALCVVKENQSDFAVVLSEESGEKSVSFGPGKESMEVDQNEGPTVMIGIDEEGFDNDIDYWDAQSIL